MRHSSSVHGNSGADAAGGNQFGTHGLVKQQLSSTCLHHSPQRRVRSDGWPALWGASRPRGGERDRTAVRPASCWCRGATIILSERSRPDSSRTLEPAPAGRRDRTARLCRLPVPGSFSTVGHAHWEVSFHARGEVAGKDVVATKQKIATGSPAVPLAAATQSSPLWLKLSDATTLTSPA